METIALYSSSTMEALTFAEQQNNQLFLDLYFMMQKIERLTAEMNTLTKEYKSALLHVKGKRWIVEYTSNNHTTTFTGEDLPEI